MLKQTNCTPFRKFRSTDLTGGSFPSRVPQFAEPAGIDLGVPGGEYGFQPSVVLGVFYGATANNGTWKVRFIGWRQVGGNPLTQMWVPVILCQLACTAGLSIGVTGSEISAGVAFADTVTLTTGNDDVSIDIVSPANDTIAHVVVDLKGSQKLELTMLADFGTAEMNALISTY